MQARATLARIVVIVTALIVLMASLIGPGSAVQAAALIGPATAVLSSGLPSYNPDAAVIWANSNNRNNGGRYGPTKENRWCATYVTQALRAGGIDIPVSNGTGGITSWLQAHPDYWEARPKEQLVKGDILFLSNNPYPTSAAKLGTPDHVVIITSPGHYSAWNAERMNYPFSWFHGAWIYEVGIHFKVATTPPPALSPAPLTNGRAYTLGPVSGINGNFVLDIKGGNTANGTPITQWPRHGGPNQIWIAQAAPNAAGYFRFLSSMNLNKCLVVQYASRNNGGQIVIYDCNPNFGGNELWKPILINGMDFLQNQLSGKVLDVPGGSTTQGTQIEQWDLNYGPSQQWISVAQ